jgi:FAD/FMN-containing dehydrogenase
VAFDEGNRAAYSHDSSNYRQPPIGVVVPKSADDIVAAIAACHEHGAPVLARGCGTGLAGQTVNAAVL